MIDLFAFTMFTKSQQIVCNFKLQYSDVPNDEYLKFCSILVKYQKCYATHRNDVGKNAT